MQPNPTLGRPARMVHVARALAALSLALSLSAVPIAVVQACSCASSPLPEAILTADLAIVGTSTGSMPIGRDEMGERVLTTWIVESSRDPIEGARVDIQSWSDSGANCGISFAEGERWLVLAYSEFGALTTNSCLQNRRLNEGDAEAEAAIAELVTDVPSGEQVAAPVEVPVPVIGILAAVVLIGAASVLAFRRATR